MYTCCRHLENLEQARVQHIADSLRKYSELMQALVPPLEEVKFNVVN